MGIWEEANTQIQSELNEGALWGAANASKRDMEAFSLSDEDKRIIGEFIQSVPDVCWEKRPKRFIKYKSPDEKNRLYWFDPDYPDRERQPVPYGNQFFILKIFQYNIGLNHDFIAIFRDGVVFYHDSYSLGRSMAQRIHWIDWAKELIRKSEKCK